LREDCRLLSENKSKALLAENELAAIGKSLRNQLKESLLQANISE